MTKTTWAKKWCSKFRFCFRVKSMFRACPGQPLALCQHEYLRMGGCLNTKYETIKKRRQKGTIGKHTLLKRAAPVCTQAGDIESRVTHRGRKLHTFFQCHTIRTTRSLILHFLYDSRRWFSAQFQQNFRLTSKLCYCFSLKRKLYHSDVSWPHENSLKCWTWLISCFELCMFFVLFYLKTKSVRIRKATFGAFLSEFHRPVWPCWKWGVGLFSWSCQNHRP